MSGFALPGWSAYLIAAAVFLPALGWFLLGVLKTRRYDLSFEPIPGAFPSWRYVNFGPTVDLIRLRMATEFAAKVIAQFGPFTVEQIQTCIAMEKPARIHIMAANTWKSAAGQLVGGELLGQTLCIGPDLSSLCHEFIHLVRVRTSGDEDEGKMPDGLPGHPEWIGNGLNAADRAYRAMMPSR